MSKLEKTEYKTYENHVRWTNFIQRNLRAGYSEAPKKIWQYMDTRKHVLYWHDSAMEDYAVAHELLEKGRIRYALFFAHLCIEKMLKSLICKRSRDIAPKIHNLLRLAELTEIQLDESTENFFAELNSFNIEGRYPEGLTPPPTSSETKLMLHKTSEILEWLKSQ